MAVIGEGALISEPRARMLVLRFPVENQKFQATLAVLQDEAVGSSLELSLHVERIARKSVNVLGSVGCFPLGHK
ncbi:hypothetical protein D9M68_961750 [compost metagenome]